MKRLASIFLLVLLLSNTLLKSALIIDYWQNTREIVENCCINKNRPELNCNGKCFINLQLNKIDHQSKSELPGRIVMSDFELYTAPAKATPEKMFAVGLDYAQYSETRYCHQFSAEIFEPPAV